MHNNVLSFPVTPILNLKIVNIGDGIKWKKDRIRMGCETKFTVWGALTFHDTFGLYLNLPAH